MLFLILLFFIVLFFLLITFLLWFLVAGLSCKRNKIKRPTLYCRHPSFFPSASLFPPYRQLLPPYAQTASNSLSSPSHLTFRHLLQAVHASHRRLELRCLPVGAEQLSNARGSGSQRETRATVHGIQLLLSSLVLSTALSFETNIHVQSMKETTDWEAILQMPGPFGCLAFSGPLNWHFDWVDAG